MAVKTLGYLLDRVKLGLRDEICTLCQHESIDRAAGTLCVGCEKKLLVRQPSPVLSMAAGSIYAACEFPYTMKQLLYGLKFHQQYDKAITLSEVLMHYWRQLPQSGERHWVVVPVPPHEDKVREHLSYIARPFASEFGYDYVEDGLRWTRDVTSQHTIPNKRKRRENVMDALEVTPQLMKVTKKGMKVLVVDDLVTTGATLVEALTAIQQALPEVYATALTNCHLPLAIKRSIPLKG